MTYVRSGPGPRGWRQRALRSARLWLAPRNVLVRGNGRFHHRIVRPWQLIAVAGMCCLVAAWMSWSTFSLFQGHRAIAERDLRIAEVLEANRQIEAALAEYSSSVQFMSAKLDANRASKEDLASQNAGLQVRVAQLEQQLAAAQASRDDLGRQLAETGRIAADLRERLATASGEVTDLRETTSNLSAQLSRLRASDQEKAGKIAGFEAEQERRAAELERRYAAELASIGRAHADEVAAVEQRLYMAQAAARQERLAYERRLEAMTAHVADVEEDRDALAASNEALRAEKSGVEERVATLEADIETMRAGHEVALQRIQARTDSEISVAEELIAATGIDLQDLLDAAPDGSGQGGPFVPFADDAVGDQSVLAAIRRLEDRIEYKDKLLSLQLSLPLRPPVAHVSISSEFGKRKDPKTGRRAIHEGIDFRGASGTPVLAAGAGTVTYAGWYGDYGRLVEIDHGLGLRTRYAHLKKVEVRKGDAVEPNQPIGQLGNSGRSTGPHLHYEVLFEEDPVDPANFMKVGQNVCKG